MERFFTGIISPDVLKKSIKILSELEKDHLRALKSNLRRNQEIRDSVNNGKIPIEELIKIPIEQMADDEVKKMRERHRKQNLRDATWSKVQMSKYDIDIIVNKIEDP